MESTNTTTAKIATAKRGMLDWEESANPVHKARSPIVQKMPASALTRINTLFLLGIHAKTVGPTHCRMLRTRAVCANQATPTQIVSVFPTAPWMLSPVLTEPACAPEERSSQEVSASNPRYAHLGQHSTPVRVRACVTTGTKTSLMGPANPVVKTAYGAITSVCAPPGSS